MLDGRSPHRTRPLRAGLGLRILLVEDDEQLASVVGALLESEGYEVTLATTAAAGLERLASGSFHLIVSDYWLPDRTGAWMLNEACARNLLGEARIVVVTAEHRPQGVENQLVLRKPLDLDEFLRVLHDVLLPVREEELSKSLPKPEEKPERESRQAGAAKVELVLYISASSPSSLKAVRNLRRLLADYPADQIELTVRDLSREPSHSAEQDRIAFTPTLVKKQPEPKVWVLGDLENGEIVEDLLSHSGVEKAR